MRSKLTWVVLFSAAIGITATFYVGKVSATPAIGFKATTIATGTFDEIDAFNHSSKHDAKDQGTLRFVRAEQYLAGCQSDNGNGGQHGLAHPPRSQPDHCHVRKHNGLYGRLHTSRVHVCPGTAGPHASRSWQRPSAHHPERRLRSGVNHRRPACSVRSGQSESPD
jgi:hypothetical protein